jgi:tRNA G18 (ribose-2'-O)-methylase SpoU
LKVGKNEEYGLILGNETRGVNLEKFRIPKDLLCKVHIPIQHVESLNVAVAGSIIMHHLKTCRSMNK